MMRTLKFNLKHATNSIWSTAPVPVWDTEVVGATEVFTSSTNSIPTGNGWIGVPFTTPFAWNGTDNIVVMVEWDRASAPTGAINWGRSTDATMNATRVGSNSLAALVMLVNGNRPLVQLVFGTPTDPVTDVIVTTQNSVPAEITINGGSLQLDANVLPTNTNQNVTWSVVNGTGMGTITQTGLLTAQTNGTVWAKAVSVADTTIMDSLLVTISNQIIPVTGVVVSTLGSVPAAIDVPNGTLQLEAAVLPASVNQNVTWSIVLGTGTASISANGLVTASADGTVYGKATSIADPSKSDSIAIIITDQTFSVAHQDDNGFAIYPNPVVQDYLNLSLPAHFALRNARVSIFTIHGKLMTEAIISQHHQRIDIQNFPAGTYVLRYNDERRESSKTFIVK